MVDRHLRQIPSVDEVLRFRGFEQYISSFSRYLVTEIVRDILMEMRKDILAQKQVDTSMGAIKEQAALRFDNLLKPSMRRIINASGVVLHTNLGRAILCNEAIEAMKLAARYPVNLEFDMEKGERGNRDGHVEDMICRLTGAEAAAIVNNNAAAVFLALNTLAEEKEVVISRGELVEIGGSFRIPDVIRKSGCRLVEVGTTNRTHPSDYTTAINQDTALFLKVHTSNYAIVGFTSNVDLKELVRIGAAHNLPVVEDLGSGSLIDLSCFGLPHEPQVRESIEAGADVVTFSGDKLLGGPQAGIIVGKKKYLQQINKNPLKRALRPCKLTFAALEATFKLYLNPDKLSQKLPTIRFLTRPVAEIAPIASDAARLLQQRLGKGYSIQIEDGLSQIGSGSLPEGLIATKVVSIVHKEIPSEKIFEMFLKNNPPILGRVNKEKFLLDMRMIEKAEDVALTA